MKRILAILSHVGKNKPMYKKLKSLLIGFLDSYTLEFQFYSYKITEC